MLTPKHEKVFLKILFDEYTKKNGYGLRNLGTHTFYITMTPSQIAINRPDGSIWYPVSELAKELASKRYIQIHEGKLKFNLTEEGYNAASKTWWSKVLTFLNKNPGLLSALAILISLGSFALAFLAYQSKTDTKTSLQQTAVDSSSNTSTSIGSP
nr:hypothetical protein [uncultured Desulfobacter sp.]